MPWEVILSRKAERAVKTLPGKVQKSLAFLLREIEEGGPVRGNWPNYGTLSEERHHCHLKKGQPTYVAVWKVRDMKVKMVEVEYVGSHEKAPY